MDRSRTRGITDGLLVIGLAASLIGLAAVISTVAGPAAPGGPTNHDAIATVGPNLLLTLPASASSRHVHQHDRANQGDSRLYLRDAAAAAQRYPWAGSRQGETRTDLWINAPKSIGSTSPPAASPDDHSVEQ